MKAQPNDMSKRLGFQPAKNLRPRFRNSKLTLSGPQDAGKLAV